MNKFTRIPHYNPLNKIQIDIIPPEILFSAWAFIWTSVYYVVSKSNLGIPLDQWDPTVAISVALSFQLLGILVIVFRAKLEKIPSIFTKFLILTAFFKLGPLWLVWNPATFDLVKSSLSCSAAFLVYLAYLYYRKLNLFEIYDDFLDSLIDDDNRIPPYYWASVFARSILRV